MIKIIESFVERNVETGELTSYYIGQIVSGSPSWEALMISENHAVNYQQGGSSDFTEAHIEVENQASGTTIALFPHTLSEGDEGALMVMAQPSYSGNVILYKGMAELHTVTSEDRLDVELDGNIEYMSNNSYAITGDCSITILSESPPTTE